MQRTPPRHLAPPQRARGRPRDHLLVEAILALVAIGITAVILIGSMLDRPESSAARLPNLLPPAPTTTRAAATGPEPTSRPAAPPDDGNLLSDAGFEAGLAPWRAVGGTGLQRVDDGRQGGWALRLTRGQARSPGVLHPEVTILKKGRRYEATAWVRSSRPGVEVQVNLLELRGGKRFAVDTVGAFTRAGEWQRLEVSHDAHRPGATLAVEILAPSLTGGTSLLVDDLAIRATSSSMSIH
jgi:Carbohydrate binding domain